MSLYDLDQLENRLSALSPGPWELFTVDDSSATPVATLKTHNDEENSTRAVVVGHPGSFGQITGRREDLTFIAEAPMIVRELVDRLKHPEIYE